MKLKILLFTVLFGLTACAEGNVQDLSSMASVSSVETGYTDIESEHPYANNFYWSWDISEPEASSITVVFDRLETEYYYDYVEITDMNGDVVHHITGNHNGESFRVEGNYLRIRLKTDYSVTSYGIKVSHYTYEVSRPRSHKPYCSYIGSRNEGWYWGDTDELIVNTKCADLPEPECGAIGSRSEGWFSEGYGLIAYDNCHASSGIAIENETCGGLIAMHCNEGLYCMYPHPEQPYPDMSGVCKPVGTCSVTEDCMNPENGWIHPMCTGEASCVENHCVWHCTNPNPNPVWSWTEVLVGDVESHHNYGNNENHTWEIHKNGASRIKAHFSRLETETYYDYVKVWSNGDSEPVYYDGSASDFWTNEFEGDTLYVRLVSDYSITRWGFKVDAVKYYENLPVNKCNSDNDCEDGLICRPNLCGNPFEACYGDCVIDAE